MRNSPARHGSEFAGVAENLVRFLVPTDLGSNKVLVIAVCTRAGDVHTYELHPDRREDRYVNLVIIQNH